MRKVGNRGLLVTTSVPGHHRPVVTKQLRCQSLHCGTAAPKAKSLPSCFLGIVFGVRQRRAGGAAGGGSDGVAHPRLRLITQQSAR